MDLTALGGADKVQLDTELMQQTVAVKDNIPAGMKTIPVVLVDQYGNKHKHEANA
jgi:pullulanase